MILKNNLLKRLICGIMLCIFLFSSAEAVACFRKPVVPDWVNTHLSDPDYFIGIGSAPIIKKQNTHIERARRDALNELASEISVQLFSSNVLVTLVRNDVIKDEFNSLIRSRVTTEIEGYELVDSYADKKNYRVYYRLSKRQYYEQQQLKRQAATQNALSFFLLATDAEKRGDLRNALVHYAKTVDAVKLYLNENIVAEVHGSQENLVVKSFTALNNILSSIKLEAANPQINLISAEAINQDKLTFYLKDANGNLVPGFPLLAYYSERAIQQPIAVTNANGRAQFAIGKVRSTKTQEVIRISPDINSILLESAADFVVRKAILEMPFQTLSVPVYIRKPSIRFEVNERNNGKALSDSQLKRTFESLSRSSGYVTDGDGTDYICFVEADTKQLSFNNGIYTFVLQGTIVLSDKQNNIKYTAQLTPVRGMQLTPEKAGIEAYNVLLQQVNSRYFREIEEAILK
ncbi:MAG: LPP20 family lipoprotein [Paludibacter sp.]|nr:LPP20 family lipoprotein [Paludibacter sp.]